MKDELFKCWEKECLKAGSQDPIFFSGIVLAQPGVPNEGYMFVRKYQRN